jgi:hypothetical protein
MIKRLCTMKWITRKFPAVMVCMVFTLPARSAFSQDEEAERAREAQRILQEQNRQRQEQEQQKWIQNSREQFINADRDNARRTLDAFSRPTSKVEREFMGAVPQFRKAVTAYREAMNLEGARKESLKDLDRFVDLFKEYFKATRVDLPTLDKAEFSGFSKKDLMWETLTTAERVDGDLRLAMKHLQEANATNTLSIEAVVFMRDLHGDVLRLEMLLSKVK